MVVVDVSWLLSVSTLGIYLHSIFVSITLGLPLVIAPMLYKWWRTKDEDYYRAAKVATGVLAVNFALGVITGTLVEFGLVQAWSGSIFVIATYAFAPLAIELGAFIGEVVLLILFIVTLKRVRPSLSLGVLLGYIVFAVFSGMLITGVNSWLQVPWGTGEVASVLYPFLPSYGPQVTDVQALVKVKLALLNNLLAGTPPSMILQNSTVAQSVGITLKEPFVALSSPYALASMLHNVTAGMTIGASIGVLGFAFQYLKTGSFVYRKLLRAVLPVLLLLLIVQPVVFGDFMGKMVAAYQPTKFAMIEGIHQTTQNPLIAFLAYGDPAKPIVGFDAFRNASSKLNGTSLGDVASTVIPGVDSGKASTIDLGGLGASDLSKAEARIELLNPAYYVKIASGVIALISVVALTALLYRAGPISRLTNTIIRPLGERRAVLIFALLMLIGSVFAAVIGWYVREAGRKPWTVYGLVYPEEIVTPVQIEPAVLGGFALLFTAVSLVGIYGMYIVSTKPSRFTDLLRRSVAEEK
ncbi:MAG: cytochrome ubiquinol oxidase subunit I [Thaumarchaeota archaeon]|nr:cytochrome ubiquinol oxidase subunit I [Nitrososphaerota archaeon]MCL5317667.1 cytochrome ubiquinol oxidase subunit I [Nitrososphaerota archaeon]